MEDPNKNIELDWLTNDDLLEEVRRGNKAAFKVFCVRVLPILARYMRTYCKKNAIPISMAKDFAQQTLLKALELDNLSDETKSFKLEKVNLAWFLVAGKTLPSTGLEKIESPKKYCMILNQATGLPHVKQNSKE